MAITESDIRDLASAQSYDRGQDYFHANSVTDIQKRGNTLLADVEGSGYEPYHVRVELDEDDVISTSCTCPYDWGGICKHIVAVLLSYIHQPKQVSERPPIEELLTRLKEADLRKILTDLLESEPHLIDQVETRIATLKTVDQKTTPTQEKKTSPPPKKQPAPINTSSFKRQTQQILRNSGYRDYHDGGWDISGQFSTLFNQANPFLEVGDGRNALLILDTVMEPFVDCWFDYDHEGEVGEVFNEVAPLFTEAILSTELSEDEKKSWKKKLGAWQANVSDYGLDDVFDTPIAALEQGWDYPPLQAVLQGKITEKGAWEGEAPMYADDLSLVRLRILERQGRTQEYLYLAEAEGQTGCYLTMLVKLDRSKEAVEYALKYAGTADEARTLSLALHEKGLIDDALNIAEYGLTLQGESLHLASWLRDEAQKQSNAELALKAAKAAFTRSSTLEDYVAAESLAGAEWKTLKPDLLAQLTANSSAYGKIDIYLHEGMHKEATEAIDKQGYWGYSTIEKVVDAVYEDFPDWAIKHCKKQAEPNMNQGKSKYYHHSVRWVEKAGKAYLAANRPKEWHEYLEGLIKKHERKYSLRPQLEALRRLSYTKAI